jgi:hypothetical protein
MTELKTLKDLNEFMGENFKDFLKISDLKSEAINYIKYLGLNNVVSEWIKYFFGITEADLQENK